MCLLSDILATLTRSQVSRSNEDTILVAGECNCGAVAFKAEASLLDVYICHCSICRKSTGSSGIAVGIVENDQFDWLKGQKCITRWQKPGRDWHTSFCAICGSPLPGPNDSQRMYVPVGALTAGHENLRVAHHIYVDSKAVWDEIGDSGRQHKGAFGK